MIVLSVLTRFLTCFLIVCCFQSMIENFFLTFFSLYFSNYLRFYRYRIILGAVKSSIFIISSNNKLNCSTIESVLLSHYLPWSPAIYGLSFRHFRVTFQNRYNCTGTFMVYSGRGWMGPEPAGNNIPLKFSQWQWDWEQVVCPQSASWLLVHCSALLWRGRYASYWNAFLLLTIH